MHLLSIDHLHSGTTSNQVARHSVVIQSFDLICLAQQELADPPVQGPKQPQARNVPSER
jgi:hypothetical protein